MKTRGQCLRDEDKALDSLVESAIAGCGLLPLATIHKTKSTLFKVDLIRWWDLARPAGLEPAAC